MKPACKCQKLQFLLQPLEVDNPPILNFTTIKWMFTICYQKRFWPLWLVCLWFCGYRCSLRACLLPLANNWKLLPVIQVCQHPSGYKLIYGSSSQNTDVDASKCKMGEVMMAFMFVFISNILKVIVLLYIFLFFFYMRMFLSFTNMKILTVRKGENV